MTEKCPYLKEPQYHSKTFIQPMRSHLYSNNNNLKHVNTAYSIVAQMTNKLLQQMAEREENEEGTK